MIQYKIISSLKLNKFITKYPKYVNEIEQLMTIHRKHPFSITDFIKEDERLTGKIIIFTENNNVISIARTIKLQDQYKISAVIVKESHRGKKLCQKMLKQLINSYDKNTKFTLSVLVDNTPAIKCYEKIGFKIIERVKHNDMTIYNMINY